MVIDSESILNILKHIHYVNNIDKENVYTQHTFKSEMHVKYAILDLLLIQLNYHGNRF